MRDFTQHRQDWGRLNNPVDLVHRCTLVVLADVGVDLALEEPLQLLHVVPANKGLAQQWLKRHRPDWMEAGKFMGGRVSKEGT